MGWLISVVGICTGNTLWLAGLVLVGIGIWGLKVKKDSILKMVGMMSLATGGQPQGFALKLKGLVDPEDRTNQFGRRMLIAGIIALVVGCSFISRCAG